MKLLPELFATQAYQTFQSDFTANESLVLENFLRSLTTLVNRLIASARYVDAEKTICTFSVFKERNELVSWRCSVIKK